MERGPREEDLDRESTVGSSSRITVRRIAIDQYRAGLENCATKLLVGLAETNQL